MRRAECYQRSDNVVFLLSILIFSDRAVKKNKKHPSLVFFRQKRAIISRAETSTTRTAEHGVFAKRKQKKNLCVLSPPSLPPSLSRLAVLALHASCHLLVATLREPNAPCEHGRHHTAGLRSEQVVRQLDLVLFCQLRHALNSERKSQSDAVSLQKDTPIHTYTQTQSRQWQQVRKLCQLYAR